MSKYNIICLNSNCNNKSNKNCTVCFKNFCNNCVYICGNPNCFQFICDICEIKYESFIKNELIIGCKKCKP